MTEQGTSDLATQLGMLPTANIGDAQERFGTATGIHAVWPGATVSGRAFTVLTRAGDNLLVHEAMRQASPGDVIVINGGGDLTRALLGDLIGIRAKALGIAGFVVDGAVRDAEGLATIPLPVFARGVTPAGPYKSGPGRLQLPVAIGGVVVAPGDFVVGDGDGVVVVPSASAAETLAAAQQVEARERDKRAGILSAPAR